MPAPPPQQQQYAQQHSQSQHPSQLLYGSNGFVSSPVSPYAPSPSQTSFDFPGTYGYPGADQTFGGSMQPQPNQYPHPREQHPHHQHQQHQGQAFTTGRHHETSPLGSDSPVLSEFGSGGSGGSGTSGASTSWHTPSPRPEIGLSGGLSLLGSGAGGGGGGGGGSVGLDGLGEEDLSGYMPMPPLRYSPDANDTLPSSNSSSTASLAHANNDMRMMSLGDPISRYSHSHSHSHPHPHAHSHSNNNANDLTFVATTINPDFLTGPLTPSSLPTHHEIARRDRSRSTSSNPPFRRRPIQLPQVKVPTTDLSTGGAYEYIENDLTGNGSAYGWESEEYDGGVGGGGNGAVGGGGGGAQRVALAPLHSLQRNHPYRRNPLDDRQLRMLGPGAR